MLPASGVNNYAIMKKFTPRQAEVLQLLLNGSSNKDIGIALDLQEQVVKNYIRVMFNKALVKSRSALVADVYEMFLESSGYRKFIMLKPQFEMWLEGR